MSTNKQIFQHTLTIGIALGLTLSAFELIGYFLGILTKPIMGLINIAIITSMLIITIRKYRDQIQGGFISFGNAFLIGLFICLISGAIWSIYRLIEYSLAPQIIEEILLMLEEKLLEANMGEDQVESLMKLYSIIYTAPVLAFTTFIVNMGFGGTILSLILAAILKREENPMLTENN